MFIAGLYYIVMGILVLQSNAVPGFIIGSLMHTLGFALCSIDYYSLYKKLHDIEDKIKNMEGSKNDLR